MPTSPAANAPVMSKNILFGIAEHRIQISIRSNTRLRKAQPTRANNLRVFLCRCFLATGHWRQWCQPTHWLLSARDPRAVNRRSTRLFAKKFDLAQRPRGGSVTNKKCRYKPPPVVPCHTRLCAYAVRICRATRDILALLEHGVHLMQCCIPGCHVRQHAPQS